MKDAHIQKFDAVYGATDCYYGTELRPEFTNFLESHPVSGGRGLDIGCGEGRYALHMAKKGCHVLALDRSRAGIEKLRRRAQDQNLPIIAQAADIEEVAFENDEFDLIVAATVLDHLADELRRRTLAQIKAALKPGGIAYVNVFTESDPGFISKTAGKKNASSPEAGHLRDISETAGCMEYYFKAGELHSCFRDFEIIYYYEGVEPDLSHGQAHHHGWACLLTRKPGGEK